MIRPFLIGRLACAMWDAIMTVNSMVGAPIQNNPEVTKSVERTGMAVQVSVNSRVSYGSANRASRITKHIYAKKTRPEVGSSGCTGQGEGRLFKRDCTAESQVDAIGSRRAIRRPSSG